MKITIRYLAQLKLAAGVGSETVEMAAPSSIRDLLVLVTRQRGEALRKMLLDSEGRVHPTILVFVGDEQVDADLRAELNEGAMVTLLSPIAGG